MCVTHNLILWILWINFVEGLSVTIIWLYDSQLFLLIAHSILDLKSPSLQSEDFLF